MSAQTPEQLAAANRITDLLNELADLIGPRMEPDLDADEEPAGQVLLAAWVMVGAWVDENGESFVTRVWTPGIPAYQRDGLLHAGIDYFPS